MSSSAVSTPAVLSSSERFTGRVKWFNNKVGYGFITVTDGPKAGTDLFVHHSSIKVDSEQYKYLVQGEYVDFSLSNTKNQDHEFQAGEVCGIKGGKLMCETRRETRFEYLAKRTDQHDTCLTHVKMPRAVSAPKEQKSQKAREPCEEGGEWSYVAKGKNAEQFASRTQRATSGRGRGRSQKSEQSDGKN